MIYKKSKQNPMYFQALDAMYKCLRVLGYNCKEDTVAELKAYYMKLVKNHGKRFACQQLKSYYNMSLKYSLGLDITSRPDMFTKRHKTTKLPLMIHRLFITDLKSKSLIRKRGALSLLRCFELITTKAQENLDSVLDPIKDKEKLLSCTSDFESFLKKSTFVNLLVGRFQSLVDQESTSNKEVGDELHCSFKRGISGPARLTVGYESQAIKGANKEALIRLSERFGNPNFKEILELAQSHNDIFQDDLIDKTDIKYDKQLLRQVLGRITFIPDKACKSRLVAIGNFWIQEVLIHLHYVLYRLLKTIPTDGTYVQTAAFDRVKEASASGPVWSYDLTTATDRYPVLIQYIVLSYFDKDIASDWRTVLESMSFSFRKGRYTYNAGQPMGLYSSWAVFTLTHHVVVQYCAWKSGYRGNFSSYAILGDDVAIWHKGTAEYYEWFSINVLGVEISKEKSFKPQHKTGPCIAEFAKRISDKGMEITPVAPGLALDAMRQIHHFPTLVEWLHDRGFPIGNIHPDTVKRVYKVSQYKQDLLVCSLILHSILRAREDLVPPGFKDRATEVASYVNEERLYQHRTDLLYKRNTVLSVKTFKAFGFLKKKKTVGCDVSRHVGHNVPDRHYIKLIFKRRDRIKDRLWESLCDYLINPDPRGGVYRRPPPLSEIEFIPMLTIEDLMSGTTLVKPKRVIIGDFIDSLARLIMKEKPTIK